jgi:cardiolipin synthase (CMP-forming)
MLRLSFIPNALSVSRVIFCPIILYLLIQSHFNVALGLFFLSAITDFLDGYLARKFGWTSALGAKLDPICDKILTAIFFGILATLGNCPYWFFGLVLSSHLLQSLGCICLNLPRLSHKSFQPLSIGKWNTALQFLWIGTGMGSLALHRQGFVLFGPWNNLIFSSGYLLLGFLQIATFLNYFFHFRVHLSPDFRLTS